MTALPNLHPAVVHFPIALLIVAVAFDLASLLLRRCRWLDRAAAALFLLGALGAWGALLSGEEAEEGLHGLSAEVGELIEEHEGWGKRTLIAAAVLALLRLGVAWRDRNEALPRLVGARAALVLAAAGSLWVLFETADRGAALVYSHGVAVRATVSSSPQEGL